MFENLSLSEAFKSNIVSAIKNSRLSHALIFEGTDEETRLKAAKETAAALVCKGEKRPCGICNGCIKAKKDIHPDIFILKKEESNAVIKVDAVRDLRERAQSFPNESEKSVYIIFEAQNMNPQGQNALLKILEEPAEHVCFILTCPSKAALLDTVISRATAYSLGEEVKTETDEKTERAKETANTLLRDFCNFNELQFLKSAAILQKDKSMFILCLKTMADIVRDCVILSGKGKDLNSGFADTAKKLSGILTLKKSMELSEFLNELAYSIEASANYNLALTRLSSKLYDIKTR